MRPPVFDLQRLKQRFGAIFDHFSSLEVQALVTADIEKRVDNRRLQQVSGVHTADITELFQSLVAKDALVKKGHGRWSWCHLTEVSREPDLDIISLDSEKHSLDNASYSLDNASYSLDKDKTRQLKKRQSQEETKVFLLDLCKEKWLSKTEIAKLMGRNAEDLRKRFINPLVLEGLLQLRYPDKPNSKEQAYRTVSKDAIESENG